MIYPKFPQDVKSIKPFVETQNQSVTTRTQNLPILKPRPQIVAVLLLVLFPIKVSLDFRMSILGMQKNFIDKTLPVVQESTA